MDVRFFSFLFAANVKPDLYIRVSFTNIYMYITSFLHATVKQPIPD